jgi:hypothetical protein
MTIQIMCTHQKLGVLIKKSFDHHGFEADIIDNSDALEDADIRKSAVIAATEAEHVRISSKYPDVRIFSAPLRLGKLLDWARAVSYGLDHKKWPKTIDMNHYLMNPDRLELVCNDTSDVIRLTEKERDILCFLWMNKPNHVDRQSLLENVWGYVDGIETHTLETHIYRLRQKIEKDPSKPSFLITDEHGYRLD